MLVITLYSVSYFEQFGSLGQGLVIPIEIVVLAALTLLTSLIFYAWLPKKGLSNATFIVYVSLVLTTGALVFCTGGAYSSFIALWIGVSLLARLFGIRSILLLLLALAAYSSYLVYSNGFIPVSAVTIAGIAGIVPIIASYIIFRSSENQSSESSTAYHELASELNQVSNKSDVVIRAINDGVIAINSAGVIELINPAAQHIIGWGNKDALGLAYQSVLKLTDNYDKPVEETVNPIYQVLETNQDIQTKNLFTVTNSGKRISLALVVSPIGQLGQGAIIVFRDITKEQAAERGQAEFISTASHEMRTPVASIEGYLGLALNPNIAQIDVKAREYILKAHESAQHLGRLFQDLLDVSKADDGRLSNHPAIIDVVEFIDSIIEGLRPKAVDKKLRLYYKAKPESSNAVNDRVMSPVYYANVDGDHLREVVSNLVENAIKYTPSGDVIVDILGDDEHTTITVQDSGIGIPREDIPHLFQKFYRVDNSSTREIGGTGLGLYLSRRLAEVMNGRIWVESEYKKGSTFFLRIPRVEREDAMRMIEQAAESSETVEPGPSVVEKHGAILPEQPATITQQPATLINQVTSPVQMTPQQPQQQFTPVQQLLNQQPAQPVSLPVMTPPELPKPPFPQPEQTPQSQRSLRPQQSLSVPPRYDRQ